MGRAHKRLVNCIASASKGKAEYKDCFILEQYIDLAKKLKAEGFSKTIVFVSSNHMDFGKPFDTREDLHVEFSDAGIQYVGDLQSAIGYL